MPITRHQDGDDIVYEVSGPLNADTANLFLDMNFEDYHRLGDAIGALIDIRNSEGRITIAALQVLHTRMRGLVFDVPVAIIGPKKGDLYTFIRGLDPLTSRGTKRIRFVSEVEEGKQWIAEWFAKRGRDRDMLRGTKTTEPTLSNKAT